MTSTYNAILEKFKKKSKKTRHYLQKNDEFCNETRQNLKEFYDFMKNEEITKRQSSSLSELIVNNFDLEQIWQEIELQNDTVLTSALASVSKLVTAQNRLNNSEENGISVEEDSLEGDEDIEHEEDLDEGDIESDESEQMEERPKAIKPSIVDDDFFKLGELEHFLNEEEKKLQEPDSGNDSENSDNDGEEDVDLFEDASEDEEDKMKKARYKDFFGNNDSKESKDKLLEEDEEEQEPLSTYEQRQERLSRKIEEIEEIAISEKPWQLKGEIKAADRPQNSLLQEVVEFDLSTRPAPVITEQTTFQLEDIIKGRIKNRLFDSVVRKSKAAETPLEFKKKLVLSEEKSKESLAQIYEKEFLEQQAALDPEQNTDKEETPLHKEINSLMNSLFTKLNSLSNFYFTPKPAVPDLKIVSNLPAISMEEVAPVASSDAHLLAPQEVKRNLKGELIGKADRTKQDKNRERRKKKLKQKIHAKKKIQTTGKNSSKENLQEVLKNKNVNKISESDRKIKSSKAFFTQLQEEVKTQVKRRASEGKAEKAKAKHNVKRLKL